MSSSERDTAAPRTLTALPFRRHASVTCPPAADLATSLSWELGELDADRVERALTALVAAVPPEFTPEAQLRALGEAVASCTLTARLGGGTDELLIDRVLGCGHGHPILLVVVLAEIGRRAGLPVGIVGGASGHFLAHQRLTEPLLLDPATGTLVDAGALGPLEWRCGHQIAAELLDLLQPRYERCGDITRALHVARLRCTLPFEDTSEAEQRLRRITSRLN